MPLSDLCLANSNIWISPYTFWELLCHLDEGDFHNWQKRICSCSYIKFLDEPRARRKISQTDKRIPDYILIPGIIKNLEKAKSLEEFYMSAFIDPNGESRLIKDCSMRVRNVLDDEAEKYFGFVSDLKAYFSLGNYNFDSDRDCHHAILSLIEGQIILSNNTERIKIIDEYYLYFAYIFERVKKYHERGKNPPRNDYEDGVICLHLTLRDPVLFISRDKGLAESLENALNRLKRLGNEFIIEPKIRIIYLEHNEKLILSQYL